MIRKAFLALVLAGTVALFSGCIAVGTVPRAETKPTLGKELQDLKEAHQKGAINDEEYDQAKKNLLKVKK